MNAIKFEATRYGYRADVGAARWQIRHMGANSHTYACYTTDDIEAYEDLPTFYGDLIDVRRFLNGIARDFADSTAS